MAQHGGRALALMIGSAVLGSIATVIFLDSTPEQSQQTQLSRKTDPNIPPKPIWKSAPDEIRELRKNGKTSEKPVPDSVVNVANDTKPITKRVRATLENPPVAAQLRAEAQLDAHGTPRALLEFAEELAQSMEGAFANPEARYQVSRQLMACARDAESKGSAQAARALCLANLERLKNKYPDELSAPYISLIAELPDDLVFVAGVRTLRDTEK